MIPIHDFFAPQLNLYKEQASAMVAGSFAPNGCEEIVDIGLYWYERIKRLDDRWVNEFQGKENPFESPIIDDLEWLYKTWQSVTNTIVCFVERLEEHGHAVPRSDELRRAQMDVRSKLSIPLDRVRQIGMEPLAGKTSGEMRRVLQDSI